MICDQFGNVQWSAVFRLCCFPAKLQNVCSFAGKQQSCKKYAVFRLCCFPAKLQNNLQLCWKTAKLQGMSLQFCSFPAKLQIILRLCWKTAKLQINMFFAALLENSKAAFFLRLCWKTAKLQINMLFAALLFLSWKSMLPETPVWRNPRIGGVDTGNAPENYWAHGALTGPIKVFRVL